MDEMTLAIVGIDYPNDDRSSRRFELLVCKPGDAMELRPEPKNQHDRRAIAVHSPRGVKLGYIPAERAALVGAKIRGSSSVTAIYQGLDVGVAYVRVRFGGGSITLPPPPSAGNAAPPRAPRRSDDDDFYPDPDGPTWGA